MSLSASNIWDEVQKRVFWQTRVHQQQEEEEEEV
jgi:hypothetical protein